MKTMHEKVNALRWNKNKKKSEKTERNRNKVEDQNHHNDFVTEKRSLLFASLTAKACAKQNSIFCHHWWWHRDVMKTWKRENKISEKKQNRILQ